MNKFTEIVEQLSCILNLPSKPSSYLQMAKVHHPVRLQLEGMTCSNCALGVERRLVVDDISLKDMLQPMFAALAMAFSDVFVIGNSIRLKLKKVI